MLARRALLALAAAMPLLPAAAASQSKVSASDRLNEAGPENTRLAAWAGNWDVVETLWLKPGAPPKVISGLVAERRMIGSILQETLRGVSDPTPLRIDYLTFNRLEGHWQYVSMDFRVPVGLMPASSFDRGEGDKIELLFQPFAFPGDGQEATGQMLRMKQIILTEGPNRQTKDQSFVIADGQGTAWAHRYAYTRQS